MVLANLSLQDLEDSSDDSSDDAHAPEMSFDLPLVALESTLFESPPAVDKSTAFSRSPTPPAWSPTTLSFSPTVIPSASEALSPLVGGPIQQSTPPQGA